MAQRKPGCYNRNGYADEYQALGRVYLGPNSRFTTIVVDVQNTASKLCRSDYDIKKEGDCAGCTAPHDHEYFKQMGLV